MNRLLEIGFECVGHWILNDGQPMFTLSNHMNTKNILYAFVSNGEIKYIGKTTLPLKRRMYGYQNPGPTQSTSIRNNKHIRLLLESEEAVDIFVLPDNGLLHYGGFHINLAAGLEDNLIAKLSPPWNGGRRESSDKKDVSAEHAGPSDEGARDEGLGLVESVRPDLLRGKTKFVFKLRSTYFNQGFFNISVKHAQALGADRDKIEIYVGKHQDMIQGYINRSVNTNDTPRIMGGIRLRNWFQENLEVDDPVIVEVLSPTSIWLYQGGLDD